MGLIGRLFVIFFAFLAACLVAGMIVVFALLFPDLSDLGPGFVDQSALNIVSQNRTYPNRSSVSRIIGYEKIPGFNATGSGPVIVDQSQVCPTP